MAIEILQVPAEALNVWTKVPISFRIDSIFEVVEINGGLGGLGMIERKVDLSYLKDYDSSNHPTRWFRFGVLHWGFFQAIERQEIVGCAAVSCRSPEISLLEGRTDVALLWDIRVHPTSRNQGIGSKLFHRAVQFARTEGYKQLRIETQNTNVPACKFYVKQGCRLKEIHRYAYREPENLDETMLVWCLDL